MTSLYDFSVLNQDNQETPLETYRGKVLLICQHCYWMWFNAPVPRTSRTL